MDNNSKSYLIYIFNEWLIIPFFLLGGILPLIIVSTFFESKNPILFFLLYIPFMIGSYILTRKLGLRPIQVHFDTEKIVFEFLTKDLKKVRKKKTILMKYIIGYSDFSFGGHDVFKLKLRYNSTYKLSKNGLWNKNDDFEMFSFDFKEFIYDFNTSENIEDGINPLRKKIEYKDFFQTQNATILFYVIIAITILVVYMLGVGKSNSISGSLVAIGGMLGYIGTYLTKRNRKKED